MSDCFLSYASTNSFAYLDNGLSQHEMNPDADVAYYIRDRDDGASMFGSLFSKHNAKDFGDKLKTVVG
jgi:hypothetical protein